MNLDEIRRQDDERENKKNDLEKKKSCVQEKFEELMELGESQSKEVEIKKACRDEVKEYFKANGFEESDRDEHGRLIGFSSIIHFKSGNSWINVWFTEISSTEEIYISRPIYNEDYLMKYIVDNKNLFVWKVNPKINNEPIHSSNYKESIWKCDSIEELSEFEGQIKENIEYMKGNIENIKKVKYIYQLIDGRQFTTFEEAFNNL